MTHAEPPPPQVMYDLIQGAWTAQAIAAVAQLGVADALADGPLTLDELAGRVGADPDALSRLLRATICKGIFARHDDGRYGLNALSDVLRSDAPVSMRALARFVGAPQHREHWSGLADAIRTGRAVVPALRGQNFFEYIGEETEFGSIFNDAMTGISSFSIGPLVAAYDFTGFRTVIDVGGGHGRLLAAILASAPDARGVLYDLPEVIAGAPPLLRETGAAERVRLVEGSFFDQVPAGGDAYVLKNIIHDWPDDQALQILRNVRSAAGTGATLLLVEAVIPDGDGESGAKWVDLEMLVVNDGRERTAAEYGILLEKSGFRLTRVVPTAAPFGVIEARAV